MESLTKGGMGHFAIFTQLKGSQHPITTTVGKILKSVTTFLKFYKRNKK